MCGEKAVLRAACGRSGVIRGRGDGAGVKSVPGKEKYECSLLCETNSRARGGRGRGHAAPGCSCRRGAGVLGGPRASRPAADGGPGIAAARAAAVLARPRPVQSAPRSDPRGGARGARVGRPSKVSTPGGPSALDRAPRPALRRSGLTSRREAAGRPHRPGLVFPARLGPDAGAWAPGDPPPRRPAWAWPRGPRGLTPGPGGQTEPRRASVTCPGRPWWGSPSLRTTPWAGPYQGPGRALGVGGQATRPGRPPRAPRRPLKRSPCAGAGRRRPGLSGLGGAGSGPDLGRCPAGPPGHPRAMAYCGGGAGGVEGAKRWRRRRGPGAGNQRLGMAARRVAPGQARGMKGSLSSSDTASGFLLPPPPASLIGAGC